MKNDRRAMCLAQHHFEAAQGPDHILSEAVDLCKIQVHCASILIIDRENGMMIYWRHN
jgi:hypothetical protein